MAINNFKPELWNVAILEQYKNMTVSGLVTQAPTNLGGKGYHWTKTGNVAVQDYSGTVTASEVDSTDVVCNYDKKKYFAVKLDDCDAVQLAGDLLTALTREGAYNIAKEIDKAVFESMGQNTTIQIGTTSAKKKIATSEMVYDYIVDLGTELDKKDVPEFNRFVIAPPEVVNLLAKDKRVIDNVQIMSNGVVNGMVINNMQVVKSNNLPQNKVIACDGSAQGLGVQINNIEAIRDNSSFSDIVRGLAQFGTKTIRENGIAILHYQLELVEKDGTQKVEVINTTEKPVNVKSVGTGA